MQKSLTCRMLNVSFILKTLICIIQFTNNLQLSEFHEQSLINCITFLSVFLSAYLFAFTLCSNKLKFSELHR